MRFLRTELRRVGAMIVMAVAVSSTACGSEEERSSEHAVFDAVCEDRPGVTIETIEHDITTIGPTSNAIRRSGGYLWIVESGSNTVSRMEPRSSQFDAGFIDVGNERGPYDVFVDDNVAYITNIVSETLTVADATTGDVIEEIESETFRKPQGVAATTDHVYVTNSNNTDFNEFGPGSVTVIDRASLEVIGVVETAAKNPQFVDVIDYDGETLVIVSSSGAVVFEEGARVASDGAAEIWRETGEPLDPARTVAPLPMVDDVRVGAPGRPLHLPGTSRVFFASGTAPVLFELDLSRGGWTHGTTDPLWLYEHEGDALHHATLDDNGIVYVTSFNRDALFVFDTSCNETLAGPIDVGRTDMLEGPHGIALDDPAHPSSAIYITSLANAAGRIELSW